MISWLGDLWRIAWSLLYWNVRKTGYRLRRGRVECPCQNPSDSGRGGETRCEACATWNRAERFRFVCPLLRPGADGELRCSVDADAVRPFWGRAMGFYAAGTLGAYLLVAVVAFGGLRWIGYDVRFRTVAWPPAWSEFQPVRSDLFYRRAQEAYRSQRINEAILSLSLAYEIDPGNYAAGMLLAQLWQLPQPTLSDRTYDRLMREHPAQRADTAQAWFRALVRRGDFTTLTRLSADAIRFDPDHAVAWCNALLFSSRYLGRTDPLQEIVASESGVDPVVRGVLDLELTLGVSTRAQQTELLLRSDLESPFAAYYRINRLLALGAGREALDLFERIGGHMVERDRISTQLDLYAVIGWEAQALSAFQVLLRGQPSSTAVEIVCAHLIRHPNRELADFLFNRIDAAPLALEPQNYAGYAALFCTAGTYRDTARLERYASALKQLTASEFSSLVAAQAFFAQRERDPSRSVSGVLNLLQLVPLDVTYALFQRYPDQRTDVSAATP